MREISLGQYYPKESPMHRMDPRTKLMMVVLYIVMIFFIRTFTGYGIAALLVFFGIFASRIPVRKVLRSVRPILLLILFTVLLTILFFNGEQADILVSWWIIKIYRQGLINAALIALRLVLLIMGPSLLTLTTTPVALTDGLERLLKPLTWIKFPVHELAIIMSIALRLIPTLSEETEKIINAQKARGADFESGNLFRRAKAMLPILIPLFVSSLRRAEELADAMDSRCYRGAKGRTRMKVLKYALRDLIGILLMLAVFFVLLVLRYNWFGFAFIGLLR